MSKHWSTRVKIQKMDRRMSGHSHFKYRLEFPWAAFNASTKHLVPYFDRTKTFYEFCQHLTEVYGYGPSVDDVGMYATIFDVTPKWGFRLGDSTHLYTVYVADDEGRQELEKVLSFNILKH